MVVAQYRKEQEQNEKKMEVVETHPREFLDCCVRQCTEDLGGVDNFEDNAVVEGGSS